MQKIVIAKTCDVAGEDVPAVASYDYSYEGERYTIDLGEEHAKLFEAEMTYWIGASRHPETGNGKKSHHRRKPSTTRRVVAEVSEGVSLAVDNTSLREWAREHGWPDLSNRGRVSKEIKEAYQLAN